MAMTREHFETRSEAPIHEGSLAKMIEHQTAQIPSDAFLWAALGSIGGALYFKMAGRTHDALFVGQWAPTFLILGLYNKIVKVAGSDRRENEGFYRSHI